MQGLAARGRINLSQQEWCRQVNHCSGGLDNEDRLKSLDT